MKREFLITVITTANFRLLSLLFCLVLMFVVQNFIINYMRMTVLECLRTELNLMSQLTLSFAFFSHLSHVHVFVLYDLPDHSALENYHHRNYM